MVKLSIEDFFNDSYKQNIIINDIEIKNGDMIPTYFLMKKLEKIYKKKLWFLIGSDVLGYLHKFKEFEKIKKEINIVIVKRYGFLLKDYENNLPENYLFFDNDWDCCNKYLSSTIYRKSDNKINSDLLTKSVIEYIKINKLYQ